MIGADLQRELGRKLYAAYISWKVSIGLDYAYRQYAKDAPVGEFWRMLARHAWCIDEGQPAELARDWQPPADRKGT